jgi:hypothetical protein
MLKLKPGSMVYLKYKGELHPRFFVGYSSKGLPVIEVNLKGTTGYMTVKENRLIPKTD